MKVLITGGCGFIGSNLAEKLSKEHDVVILDDLSTGRIENIEDIDVEFIDGSVTDLEILKNICRDVDFIFHQAAISSVQRSIDDPLSTNEVNIKGTLNVLIAAKDCNVKKVICASSSSIYGNTPHFPLREDMIPDPRSPYAVTKLTGEYYCNIFNEIHGLETVSLRYFNVYGPRQDPSSDYAAVIPKFINLLLNNKPPIIYGDGEQTRDFVYVQDVVQANILAMETDALGVLNVASGKQITINGLADTIMGITGKHFDCIHDSPVEGDVRHSVGDASKMIEFGFIPEYSMEEGLKNTVKWSIMESGYK